MNPITANPNDIKTPPNPNTKNIRNKHDSPSSSSDSGVEEEEEDEESNGKREDEGTLSSLSSEDSFLKIQMHTITKSYKKDHHSTALNNSASANLSQKYKDRNKSAGKDKDKGKEKEQYNQLEDKSKDDLINQYIASNDNNIHSSQSDDSSQHQQFHQIKHKYKRGFFFIFKLFFMFLLF